MCEMPADLSWSLKKGTRAAQQVSRVVDDKLHTLGLQDQALTDYIVVLLLHGNRAHVMAEQLQAFMGDRTAIGFTRWLFQHLEDNKRHYVAANEEHDAAKDQTRSRGDGRSSDRRTGDHHALHERSRDTPRDRDAGRGARNSYEHRDHSWANGRPRDGGDTRGEYDRQLRTRDERRDRRTDRHTDHNTYAAAPGSLGRQRSRSPPSLRGREQAVEQRGNGGSRQQHSYSSGREPRMGAPRHVIGWQDGPGSPWTDRKHKQASPTSDKWRHDYYEEQEAQLAGQDSGAGHGGPGHSSARDKSRAVMQPGRGASRLLSNAVKSAVHAVRGLGPTGPSAHLLGPAEHDEDDPLYANEREDESFAWRPFGQSYEGSEEQAEPRALGVPAGAPLGSLETPTTLKRGSQAAGDRAMKRQRSGGVQQDTGWSDPTQELAALKAQLKNMEQQIEQLKGSDAAKAARVQQPVGSKPQLTYQQALAAAKAAEEARSVAVQNVSAAIPEEVIRAHFSVCGPMLRMTRVKSKMSGAPSSTVLIEFSTSAAAETALALSGSLLLQSIIQVVRKQELHTPKPSPRGPPPGAVRHPPARQQLSRTFPPTAHPSVPNSNSLTRRPSASGAAAEAPVARKGVAQRVPATPIPGGQIRDGAAAAAAAAVSTEPAAAEMIKPDEAAPPRSVLVPSSPRTAGAGAKVGIASTTPSQNGRTGMAEAVGQPTHVGANGAASKGPAPGRALGRSRGRGRGAYGGRGPTRSLKYVRPTAVAASHQLRVDGSALPEVGGGDNDAATVSNAN